LPIDLLVTNEATHGSGSYDIKTVQPEYPYNKSIELIAGADGSACHYSGSALTGVRNLNKLDFDYLSFIVRGYTITRSTRGSAATYLYLYDIDGVEIAHYTLIFLNNHDLYEILLYSGNVYLVINGESQGIIGNCPRTPKYFEISVAAYAPQSCGSPQYGSWATVSLIIDDLTTLEGFIAFGVENNAHYITDYDNPVINLSYHMKTLPYESYYAAEYTVSVLRVETGEVISSTIVKQANDVAFIKPAGCLSFDRSMFNGVYGLYEFDLTMDGRIIDTDYLFYTQIPPPVECTQEFVITDSGSPVIDAYIQVYDQDRTLCAAGSTDELGSCLIGLDTRLAYYIVATKGTRTLTSNLFLPCVQTPLSFDFSAPGPRPNRSWLVPMILVTLAATGSATWAVSD
jgi:hypothetical protein